MWVRFAAALRGGLRSGRPAGRRLAYFPPFEEEASLADHHHRARWYLPWQPGVLDSVELFASNPSLRLGPPPAFMGEVAAESRHIRLGVGSVAALRAMLAADVVLRWRKPRRLWERWALALAQAAGGRVVNVDTLDPDSREYGAYPGITWRFLLSREQKEAALVRSRASLQALHDRLGKRPFSAVFGTGPSLRDAVSMDFSGGFVAVCNSIVQDDALLDHLAPHVVTAGDAISHFGVSAYAARFREDLVRALRERDLVYLGTATFGHLLTVHHPEVADRVLLIDQKAQGPVLDLLAQYEAPRLDSTMNIHLLPLAATFSDNLLVLGADGKAAPGSGSRDEDFWAHAPGAQYHELVDTGHACHPTFEAHRAASTWERHIASVEASVAAAESAGKRVLCLSDSTIPAFGRRSFGAAARRAAGLGEGCRVAEVLRAAAASGSSL